MKYLVLSDIHFFHPRTPTSFIIRNLDEYFDNYGSSSKFCDLDCIFLAGDVFDDLMNLEKGADFYEIVLWIRRLMTFCFHNKIKLRVLRGTPSHDWRQSKLFETVFNILDLNFDFKYVDTLSIEFLPDLNYSVLYVPDEWSSSGAKTLQQVHKLLDENHISQVDIAIMHGMFRFQLPQAPVSSAEHDQDAYLNIVKYFINIGHIHTHSVYKRILAQGSFDRLAHNEEGPKGGMIMVIDDHGDNSYFFIENKNAKEYKTVTLRQNDLEKSLDKIEKETRHLKDDAYIRIKAKKDHPVYVAFDQLKIRFSRFIFSKTSIDQEDEEYDLTEHQNVLIDNPYKPVQITAENIEGLLMSEIHKKHNLSARQLGIVKDLFRT
jgi:hypothetical protein